MKTELHAPKVETGVQAQTPGSEAPLVPETPAGNLTVEALAQRRSSRRRASSAGATPGQPAAPTAAPASAPGAVDGQPPDPALMAASATEQPAEQPENPEGEAPVEGGAQPAGDDAAPVDALDQLIESAITEAAAAPDRAGAIRKMARRLADGATERETLKARVAELEAKLTKPAAPEAPARNAASIDTHPELAAIDQKLIQLRTALATITRNPDGYTYTHEGKEVTLGAEELLEMKENYEWEAQELRTQRHAKAQALEAATAAQRAQINTQAMQLYPWLAKREAPETQLAISELAQFPVAIRQAISKLPQFNLIMARYVRGLQAEQAAATKPAAAARPTSHGTTPPRVVAGPGVKTADAGIRKQVKDAEELARRTGRPEHIAQARALKRQLQTAA